MKAIFFNPKFRAALFWACVTVSALVFFSPHLRSVDEGVSLNAAWQLWNGKELYIDVVEFVAPGVAVTVATLWKVLGSVSYASAKLLSIILAVAGAYGFFLTVRKITGNERIARLAALFWLFVCLAVVNSFALINHSTWSGFFAIWFVFFLVLSIEKDSPLALFATGAFGGATALMLQTRGIAITGAALVFFFLWGLPIRSRFRRAFAVIAGFVVITVPLLLFWDFGTLQESLFWYPIVNGYLQYTHVSLPLLILEGAVVALLLTFAARERNPVFWALTVVQVGLFASNLNLLFVFHFALNIFPALACFLSILARYPSWFTRSDAVGPELIAFLLAIGLIATFFVPISGVSPFERSIYNIDMLGTGWSGLYREPRIAEAKTIYAGAFLPDLYFELRKLNPFPISNFVVCNPECQEKMLDIFQNVEPGFAFLEHYERDPFAYPGGRPIDKLVLQTYAHCQLLDLENVRVYARYECP